MTPEELQFALDEGEGQKNEFKPSITSSLDRELVAFANSSGGRVFLGVNDANKVSGISVTNENNSRVQDIANNCQPAVKIRFEAVEGVNNVLVVHAPEFNLSANNFYLNDPFRIASNNATAQIESEPGRFFELINGSKFPLAFRDPS